MEEIIKFFKFLDRVEKLLSSMSMKFLTIEYLKAKHNDLLQQMEYYYGLFYDKKGACCGANQFYDSFILLKTLNKNKIVKIMNVKHKIKGEVVYDIDGQFYSAKSPHLTNEVCEKIFKRYGSDAFDYYDKDWKNNEIKLDDVEKAMTQKELEKNFAIMPKNNKDEIKETIIQDKQEDKVEEKKEEIIEEVIKDTKVEKKQTSKKKTTKKKGKK